MPRVYTGPRGGKYMLVKGRRRYLPKKRKGRKRAAKKGSGSIPHGWLAKKQMRLDFKKQPMWKQYTQRGTARRLGVKLGPRVPKKKPKKGSGKWSYHVEPGEVRWYD